MEEMEMCHYPAYLDEPEVRRAGHSIMFCHSNRTVKPPGLLSSPVSIPFLAHTHRKSQKRLPIGVYQKFLLYLSLYLIVGRRSIVDEISVFLNTLRIFPFVFLLESERRSISRFIK